jgi:hypothetical protein
MKFATLALVGSAAANCCGVCNADAGEIKAFSIDHIFNMCGECCLQPGDFWKYKIFELGLTKADAVDSNPCSDAGYSVFKETDTHGVPGVITMTLDMYKKPAAQDDSIAKKIHDKVHHHKEKIIEKSKEILHNGIDFLEKHQSPRIHEEPVNECDALSESACHADHACSWCTSFAVRNKCNTVADAKALPSSIFICDNLGAKAAEPCSHPDKSSCDNDAECSWCTSFAVRDKCNTIADAKGLPASIFICDKLSAKEELLSLA